MKRTITSILALVVALSMITCVAYADQITFRGISWGQRCADVISDLKDLDLSWREVSPAVGQSVSSTINQETVSESSPYNSVCTIETRKCNAMVAGYDVSDIKLYFVYTPNAKGLIDQSVDNTFFYMAEYIIEPSDLSTAMLDLESKLTNLYGSSKSSKNSEDCSSTYRFVSWEGDGETVLTLVGEQDDMFDMDKVHIYYAFSGADSMIRTAENLLRQAEAAAKGAAGSDGL